MVHYAIFWRVKRATKKTRDLGKVIQKSLDSSIDRVRKKGNERLTVMIIPHGQEKIFSLQLNWLMIAFLVGIVLSAVSLASYAAYRQAIKQREVLRLKSMYGVNFNSAMLLSSHSRGMIRRGCLRDHAARPALSRLWWFVGHIVLRGAHVPGDECGR
ncbi:MAG: hypothetical protein HY042_06940 [Spirochaetia bacterium]|nr:hypothetical protein [Spirochaetia bacterium]